MIAGQWMRGLGAMVLLMPGPAAERRYLAYERPVVGTSHAGQSCAALDAVVLAHAAKGLGDLRLYRDGEETPYALRRVEQQVSPPAALTLLNRGTRDGRSVFDAAMPEGPYSDLDLVVNGVDFLATVAVTGSDTESGVATKLGEYTIFDLSGQQLGRSTVLHLPESDFRYLHFAVAGSVPASSFSGVSVQQKPLEETRYVTVASSSESVEKGVDTVFTLPVAKGVPVERLVVEPGKLPAEFSRDVSVKAEVKRAGGGNATEWNAAQERLLRVHRVVNGRHIDEEQLEFALRMGTLPEDALVTVTIHNGSDAPMAVQSVRLEMVERDLCFDAATRGSYVLAYGDTALGAPDYEYARLFAADKLAQRVELGTEMRNPAYTARPDTRPFTERHRWLLWAGLVAVIGVLGLVAIRTARQAAPRAK